MDRVQTKCAKECLEETWNQQTRFVPWWPTSRNQKLPFRKTKMTFQQTLCLHTTSKFMSRMCKESEAWKGRMHFFQHAVHSLHSSHSLNIKNVDSGQICPSIKIIASSRSSSNINIVYINKFEQNCKWCQQVCGWHCPWKSCSLFVNKKY